MGETVLISGVTLPGYDGTFVVASVNVPLNQFTYALVTNPGNTTTNPGRTVELVTLLAVPRQTP